MYSETSGGGVNPTSRLGPERKPPILVFSACREPRHVIRFERLGFTEVFPTTV